MNFTLSAQTMIEFVRIWLQFVAFVFINTDLTYYFDAPSNKLYINIDQNPPEKITIEYVPRFTDISQIKSDYWIDVIIRMATARTKIIVGNIRSKFKQSNALWSLDGDDLKATGTAELDAIR